jgi:hypothetical protein
MIRGENADADTWLLVISAFASTKCSYYFYVSASAHLLWLLSAVIIRYPYMRQ